MKLSRNIPIIILVLITLLIGFVLLKNRKKHQKQIESNVIKPIKNKKKEITNNIVEEFTSLNMFNPLIEGVDEGNDSCSVANHYRTDDLIYLKNVSGILTSSEAKKILGEALHNKTHVYKKKTIDGMVKDKPTIKINSWNEIKEETLNNIPELYINKKTSLGKSKVKCLIGKFIIVKDNNKYSVIFKKDNGWLGEKQKFDTFNAAMDEAMREGGMVKKNFKKGNDVLPLSGEDLKEFLSDEQREQINKLNEPIEKMYSCVKTITSSSDLNNIENCEMDNKTLNEYKKLFIRN